jgi:hypothetical protein
MLFAYIENTGMIMNRPNMRRAKIAASESVARNSGALIREWEIEDVEEACMWINQKRREGAGRDVALVGRRANLSMR